MASSQSGKEASSRGVQGPLVRGSSSGGNLSQRRSDGPWRPREKEKTRLSDAPKLPSGCFDPELCNDGQSLLKPGLRYDNGGVPRKLTFEEARGAGSRDTMLVIQQECLDQPSGGGEVLK